MINGLIILSSIVSEFAYKYGIHNSRDQLKRFRILNNISFMSWLPDFDESKPFASIGKRQFPVGTILTRPLDIPIRTEIKHYFIAVGTTVSGQAKFIEMTKQGNVRIVGVKEVMQGFDVNTVKISPSPKGLTRQTLFERAEKFQFDSYSLFDLNCYDFAMYCAYLIEPEKRSKILFEAGSEAAKIAIKGLELQEKFTSDPELKRWLQSEIKRRQEQQAFNKFRADHSDNSSSEFKKVRRIKRS